MGGSKGGGDTKVKPTAAQIAQEEVAWKGWQDYKNILRPAEDNFMEKVDDLNSEQQYDNIAGTTNLGYQKQFGEARKELAGNLAQSGVDPSSGRFNAVMNANQSDQVTGQIDTTTRGRYRRQISMLPGYRMLLLSVLVRRRMRYRVLTLWQTAVWQKLNRMHRRRLRNSRGEPLLLALVWVRQVHMRCIRLAVAEEVAVLKHLAPALMPFSIRLRTGDCDYGVR